MPAALLERRREFETEADKAEVSEQRSACRGRQSVSHGNPLQQQCCNVSKAETGSAHRVVGGLSKLAPPVSAACKV